MKTSLDLSYIIIFDEIELSRQSTYVTAIHTYDHDDKHAVPREFRPQRNRFRWRGPVAARAVFRVQ